MFRARRSPCSASSRLALVVLDSWPLDMLSRDSVATLRPTTRLLLAGRLIPPQGAAVPPAAGPGLRARWSTPAPARAVAELGDGERNYTQRERGIWHNDELTGCEN